MKNQTGYIRYLERIISGAVKCVTEEEIRDAREHAGKLEMRIPEVKVIRMARVMKAGA